MIEKVNPKHPDKIADRIAGAVVDTAYGINNNAIIAVEVLIGHGICHIICETNVNLKENDIQKIVNRIAGRMQLDLVVVGQDEHLANNQGKNFKCGDNGIFKGLPLTKEERKLSKIANDIFELYPYDGKYILDKNKLIICQSNAQTEELRKLYPKAIINPLGYWTGGTNVDTGATNRKLGSDMGHSVTGGGLHGKDLTKADVSINIYAFLKAQQSNEEVNISCAIGDSIIDGKPYVEIINIAKQYIKEIGGFEKFAEWGLF